MSDISNLLVAKQCTSCGKAMHVHRSDKDVIFSGCEPVIVDIRLEKVGDNEMLIKGKRSTKAIRCSGCKSKHLLRSFEEVKDGISKA